MGCGLGARVKGWMGGRAHQDGAEGFHTASPCCDSQLGANYAMAGTDAWRVCSKPIRGFVALKKAWRHNFRETVFGVAFCVLYFSCPPRPWPSAANALLPPVRGAAVGSGHLGGALPRPPVAMRDPVHGHHACPMYTSAWGFFIGQCAGKRKPTPWHSGAGGDVRDPLGGRQWLMSTTLGGAHRPLMSTQRVRHFASGRGA